MTELLCVRVTTNRYYPANTYLFKFDNRNTKKGVKSAQYQQ